MIRIPGGEYVIGTDADERELGYRLSPPLVREQGWYDAWEQDPRAVTIDAFAIDRTPVTQNEYAGFAAATGRAVPHIDSIAYQRQGFLLHPYAKVREYLWDGTRPPRELDSHPVVLVDLEDARAYCEWRGERIGVELRLPTEAEWEASCRGTEGRTFPWGDEWEAGRAPADTTHTAPVDAHPQGATPEGVRDLLGNVFEWTRSEMPNREPVLKGCGWDDAPGTCRCGFRHGRPPTSRHILIGFRCASDL